ncbi:MAG: hypothetical protein ACI965_001180 [Paraglaciecola sp.]|jgi:hypothetical protein
MAVLVPGTVLKNPRQGTKQAGMMAQSRQANNIFKPYILGLL